MWVGEFVGSGCGACLPNRDVRYFLPLLQARVPHRLIDQERVVMTHESERHDAGGWEDVGLGELKSIGLPRTARRVHRKSIREVGVRYKFTIWRVVGLLFNINKHFCFISHKECSYSCSAFFRLVSARWEVEANEQINNSTYLFSLKLSLYFSPFFSVSLQCDGSWFGCCVTGWNISLIICWAFLKKKSFRQTKTVAT